jgi:hypothetical protein
MAQRSNKSKTRYTELTPQNLLAAADA